jgi:hypothetical protein
MPRCCRFDAAAAVKLALLLLPLPLVMIMAPPLLMLLPILILPDAPRLSTMIRLDTGPGERLMLLWLLIPPMPLLILADAVATDTDDAAAATDTG